MSRYILFIVLAVFAKQAQAQSPLISWRSANQLSWNDFKAHPDHSFDADAITSYTISLIPSYGSDNEIMIEIHNMFNSHESWVKIKSHNLLRHEQGHFNLAEIFARLLRKEISALKYDKYFNENVEFLYNKYLEELDKAQDEYDSQTDLSRDEESQRIWEKWMEGELRKLDAYRNPAIVIKPVG